METSANTSKKGIWGYRITIILLLGVIGYLTWQLNTVKNTLTVKVIEKKQTDNDKKKLQFELDSLMFQFDSIKTKYGELNRKLTARDSVILKYANQIQELLASQADARRVKRHLAFLQGHMKEYVTQLDSLFTVSRELKQENMKIKDDLKKEQDKSVSLEKDKSELSDKVTIASQLQAYKIAAQGIKAKGKEESVTDKSKRLNKVKVCFTLSKNMIIPAGSKDIYLRIAAPDESILMQGEGEEYSFLTKEGSRLQYSSKKNINYENKATDVCIYWDNATEYTPGTYYASIYTDGVLIGEAPFALK